METISITRVITDSNMCQKMNQIRLSGRTPRAEGQGVLFINRAGTLGRVIFGSREHGVMLIEIRASFGERFDTDSIQQALGQGKLKVSFKSAQATKAIDRKASYKEVA